ncbi:MAG: hypothetical protein QOK43_3010 [Acidimicrobiaceae bacterium]|nr:hypothetical protein [Acidimicrobiaceae bacterium]
MIRHTALTRWALTVMYGAVAGFILLGAVVNAAGGKWRDALLLFGFGAFLAYRGALPWVQFVDVTAGGLRYCNWGRVRFLPWAAIERFDVRELLVSKGPNRWVVTAHRPRRPPVALRAATRPGSYRARPSPSETFARGLASELNDRLRAQAPRGR